MDKELPVSAWPEWKIIEKIGEGSFGKVYKAQRTEHGKSFYSAIKIINIPGSQSELNSVRSETGDDHSAREYFQNLVEECIQEISTMEYFRGNSYIVSVEDFKVMEYLDAIGWEISIRMEYLTSFMEYCAEKQLTEKEVIQLGLDLSKALEYCRKLKIIHRDIKPENIFVSRFGDFKLGDFGIARELERTMSGFSKKGTYSYMAPEMYKSEKYDSRVDIYSLGIVLYKLMNHNRLPFMNLEKQFITYRDKENALNRRISGETMEKPVDAGEQFAEIILRACAYDPADRYQTPEEFYMALDELKNGKRAAESLFQNGQTDNNVSSGSRNVTRGNAQRENLQKGSIPGGNAPGKTVQEGKRGKNSSVNTSNVPKSANTNKDTANKHITNKDTINKHTTNKDAINKHAANKDTADKNRTSANKIPGTSDRNNRVPDSVNDSIEVRNTNVINANMVQSARAVAARKRRRKKERILRRAILTVATGLVVVLIGGFYIKMNQRNAANNQENNPVAILDSDKYSASKSDSKDFSDALETIKDQATTITDNLDTYDWVGSEGTVLRYLKRVKTTQNQEGNLDVESECMKALVYPAESGDGVYEEYFYWGEKLFFAYIWYDETAEYYYYNNNGELIRWIDSNGKCHDNETDNEEYTKRGEKYWDNSLKALKGEGTKTDNGVSN